LEAPTCEDSDSGEKGINMSHENESSVNGDKRNSLSPGTHRIHFSPRPTIRHFPSQTKPWTDHEAPKPFSTPTSQPRQRKLGYGDFLKKATDVNEGDYGANRISYPNSDNRDKSTLNHLMFQRGSEDNTEKDAHPTNVFLPSNLMPLFFHKIPF